MMDSGGASRGGHVEAKMVSLTRAASASPHEEFEYVYDLGDNWEHDIRIEKIVPLEAARAYPFALVERSLVRQKIPEALGAICLCGIRENLTEGIGKRVRRE
jgi:Plasmid pRiA4b ORF-3-like protein